MAILDKLKDYADRHSLPYSTNATSYADRVELIHGGAKGADYVSGLAARRLGWRVTVVPANWFEHGSAAGSVRNLQMLDMQPDVVLAFWDRRSKGTKHCIDSAAERNIPTEITYSS